MSDTGLGRLIALMAKHSGHRPLKRLQCARDVADELAAAGAPPPILTAWDRLTGTEVMVIPDYEPGQWKLVGHDHCSVIGGETIDQAIIVSHDECTVLGESEHPAAEAIRAADEQQAVSEARLFLASLAELTSKLLADGYPDAAAWAEQLAALVGEWVATPSDPALQERVRLAMLEFNELAGG